MSDQRYSQSRGLEIEEEDNSVAIRLTSDQWAILEGAAFDLWRLVAEPRSLSDITRTLAAAYSGDPAMIGEDVAAVLEDWESRGLVLRSGHEVS